MFSPPAPITFISFRKPFPWPMKMLSMPVPLMPSVKLAMNSHWEEAQSDEEEEQFADVLTSWHTGLAVSVTWRQKNEEWECAGLMYGRCEAIKL